MVGDHLVEVPAPRDGELEADAEPVQGRVALASEHAHRRHGAPRAVDVVFVSARLEREVVAEPLRLFVRVGVTPDRNQKRRVIHDDLCSVVELELVGDPERYQRLAQNVSIG